MNVLEMIEIWDEQVSSTDKTHTDNLLHLVGFTPGRAPWQLRQLIGYYLTHDREFTRGWSTYYDWQNRRQQGNVYFGPDYEKK